MNILHIPCYMYFGSQTIQGSFDFNQSDELYNKLLNWQNQFSYEYTGDNLDPVKIINELFQENFFTPLRNYYIILPNGVSPSPYINDYWNRFNTQVHFIRPDNLPQNASQWHYDKVAFLNNFEFNRNYEFFWVGDETPTPYTAMYRSTTMLDIAGVCNIEHYQPTTVQQIYVDFSFPIFPETLFDENGDILTDLPDTNPFVEVITQWEFDDGIKNCVRVAIGIRKNEYQLQEFKHRFNGFNIKQSGSTDSDTENPYAQDGSSTTGGGDGTLGAGGLDSIDPADIPDLPTVTAADIGFMTMYNPSKSQLKSLADFLWSGAFDLDSYKKLFSDPMESVIGLAIVPIAPTLSGSKNVMFGTIDSGVNMPTIASQFVQLDCGSVALEKYVGCFMDNDPYTKISIYLPYIGIRQLSADDLIGGSIKVVYNVDVLTGACGCFIKHSTRGVLYSFNGSCITNVPLTAINFSGAIQNAVSAVISGIGTVAGMATGAAPITAMGAMGLLNSAANTALNSKPSVQRSGNLGGSAGIMSIQKPYVIIERPNISVPNDIENYVGNTLNTSEYLYNCSGFTLVEYCHIHGIWGTENELKEIEALLKEGVML